MKYTATEDDALRMTSFLNIEKAKMLIKERRPSTLLFSMLNRAKIQECSMNALKPITKVAPTVQNFNAVN